ncbi:MAG TPA: uracil-DNA glycosylase [Armatimonadota bacterium]
MGTELHEYAREPLDSEERRASRRARLREPHIVPLVRFVEEIQDAKGPGYSIPYIDPADGGIHAKVLLVLEAPGPKAVLTGFVSRDSPDLTARYMAELLAEARLPRRSTVLWNVVPWYLGDGRRIQAARTQDIEEGREYLQRLVRLLPDLRAVVLVGKNAQKVAGGLDLSSGVTVFQSPHTSPVFVHRGPGNRGIIAAALQSVSDYLGE